MENVLLSIIKINQAQLNTISIETGQIFITSSNLIYLDDEPDRKNITSECIIADTKAELDAIPTKLINKLYVAYDEGGLYRYNTHELEPVTTLEQLYNTIENLIELMPTIIEKEEKLMAPATLASQVITSNGDRLNTAIDESKLLTVVRTSSKYYQVQTNGQRIFDIRFPKETFNFDKGDLITVVVRNKLIDSSRFEINNSCIIFNDTLPDLTVGENILVICYYRMVYDLNTNVVLGTNNIADGSITTGKLSPNFRIPANYVDETALRIFFTREYEAKLKGIEYNATCYHHPQTHPATMIDEDENHRFVSDTEKAIWNNKANSEDVYTKKQTDDRIHDIIGAAPEELDTLKELAEALNNDPNFSQTMVKELAKKATVEQLEELKTDVDNRAHKNDYIRNPIYGAVEMKYDNVAQHTNYTIKVEDPTLVEYIDGMGLTIKIKETNRGDSYIRINSLEYKKIVTQDDYDLIPGELTPKSIYSLRYNGTSGNFILQGKGGVKLLDTNNKSYAIAEGESIKRGQLVDIIDNHIYDSRPRPRILSRNETLQDKFNSDGPIRVFGMSEEEIVVFWKENVGLYGQRFLIKDHKYIDINSSTGRYLVVNGSCTEFEITKVANRKFLVVTADNKKMFTAMTVTLDAGELLFGNPYTRQESVDITNVRCVYLNNNRSIIAWQAEQYTRTMYIKTINDDIEIISNRDNIDYPLNKVCKINDSQIIFGKILNDNRIRKWTMSIVSNDFFNSTLDNIDGPEGTTFSNLAINKYDEDKVMFTATSSDLETLYTWEIQAIFNAGSHVLNTYAQRTSPKGQLKTLIPTKMQQIKYNGYYISCTPYDYTVPSITDNDYGPDCIKIAIGKFDQGYHIVDMVSDIPVLSDNIAFDMISEKHLVMVCNCTTDSARPPHLYFVVATISKCADGVALADGEAGDIIKVCVW